MYVCTLLCKVMRVTTVMKQRNFTLLLAQMQKQFSQMHRAVCQRQLSFLRGYGQGVEYKINIQTLKINKCRSIYTTVYFATFEFM